MFRCGTTLLARMLNTHRDIACASDPFRPFFNYLRYDVASEVDLDGSIDPYDPLDDYFADDDELALLRAIEATSLDREFPAEEADRLLKHVRSQGEPFSPKITDRLDRIRGDTFTDVYDDLLSYVPKRTGRVRNAGGRRRKCGRRSSSLPWRGPIQTCGSSSSSGIREPCVHRRMSRTNRSTPGSS
jgi:hypothetical protein